MRWTSMSWTGCILWRRNAPCTKSLGKTHSGRLKYDLVGKIAQGTVLTRRTVVEILKGLHSDKLYMFKNNPEEFITKVVRLINEQKAKYHCRPYYIQSN